jgi:ATP-dependent Clp protease protease subunit
MDASHTRRPDGRAAATGPPRHAIWMGEPPTPGTNPPAGPHHGVGHVGWAPFPPEWFDRPVDPLERLLRRRVVPLSGPIDAASANELMAKLLWLDGEAPGTPIDLRINSPGGDVLAGLGIIDTMHGLSSPVHATCVGVGASMASVILACATRGQRRATPNARLLLHQPWTGQFQGQAADLERAAQEVLRLRARIDDLLAESTGQPVERVHRDTDRDTWLSAEEALAYGLIDEIGSAKAPTTPSGGAGPGQGPAGGANGEGGNGARGRGSGDA